MPGGNILLEAFVDLEIDVGIDFSGDSPEFFVYDYDDSDPENVVGTHLDLGGRIVGRDLELGFDVLGFKLGIEQGIAVLDGDGNIETG